jgi:hypothetical protein
VPDGPLADLLCFLPVRDAAGLVLLDRGWREATAPDRPTLWLQLFQAKRLRPPSAHARRASRALRRAFFAAWARARPNLERLFHRAWVAWGRGGRDSPTALAALLAEYSVVRDDEMAGLTLFVLRRARI